MTTQPPAHTGGGGGESRAAQRNVLQAAEDHVIALLPRCVLLAGPHSGVKVHTAMCTLTLVNRQSLLQRSHRLHYGQEDLLI
jgi:hypothetical protein